MIVCTRKIGFLIQFDFIYYISVDLFIYLLIFYGNFILSSGFLFNKM